MPFSLLNKMGEYIAVYIPSPNGNGHPTGRIFNSVKAAAEYANTPEAKARGEYVSVLRCSSYIRTVNIQCT